MTKPVFFYSWNDSSRIRALKRALRGSSPKVILYYRYYFKKNEA